MEYSRSEPGTEPFALGWEMFSQDTVNGGAQFEFVRAYIAPIRRLDPEILREVFKHCLPGAHNAVMCNREAPLLLGQVCSYLRWFVWEYGLPSTLSSLSLLASIKRHLSHYSCLGIVLWCPAAFYVYLSALIIYQSRQRIFDSLMSSPYPNLAGSVYQPTTVPNHFQQIIPPSTSVFFQERPCVMCDSFQKAICWWDSATRWNSILQSTGGLSEGHRCTLHLD